MAATSLLRHPYRHKLLHGVSSMPVLVPCCPVWLPLARIRSTPYPTCIFVFEMTRAWRFVAYRQASDMILVRVTLNLVVRETLRTQQSADGPALGDNFGLEAGTRCHDNRQVDPAGFALILRSRHQRPSGQFRESRLAANTLPKPWLELHLPSSSPTAGTIWLRCMQAIPLHVDADTAWAAWIASVLLEARGIIVRIIPIIPRIAG